MAFACLRVMLRPNWKSTGRMCSSLSHTSTAQIVFLSELAHFKGLSFPTISSTGANAGKR